MHRNIGINNIGIFKSLFNYFDICKSYYIDSHVSFEMSDGKLLYGGSICRKVDRAVC